MKDKNFNVVKGDVSDLKENCEMDRKNLKLPLISITNYDSDFRKRNPSTGFYLDDEKSSSNHDVYRRRNAQFQRRRESLSLFTLASSNQKKFDYLNYLHEETLREQKELESLYKSTSAIINRRHSKKGSFVDSVCFTTNTFESYRRRSSINSNQKNKENYYRRKNLINYSNSQYHGLKSIFYKLIYKIFKLIIISNKCLISIRNNFKAYIFVGLIFSVIFFAIVYSFFKMIKQIK